MPKKLERLGELELEVLKTIWKKRRATVQEVAEVLAQQRGSARTTVLTVMQRLHAKGLLKRHKVGAVYQYRPTQSRKIVLSHLIGHFVDRVLDGSAEPFVAYLAESEGLTEGQLNQLREILESLERREEEG